MQLESILPKLFSIANPDLVFYQSGVDIHELDKLGKLKLTRSGIHKRNKMLYDMITGRNRLRANMSPIKLVVTMGGGYPKDNSQSFVEIIESHKDVYRDCIESFSSS